MNKLEKERNEINEIDKAMAELFEKRMAAVKEVAGYKIKNGLPITDKDREQAVIERASMLIKSDEIRDYYVSFIKSNMEISKNYQRKLMQGMKVAFCGTEGAFAHIAAKKIFPDAEFVAYGDFLSAYESVENMECDCAVLPIENSYAGDVGQVIDILFDGPLFINDVYSLSVVHNLMGVKSSSINNIKTVVSHPQALTQCHKYIKEHGFEEKSFENTALAAKHIAKLGDKTVAAIASKNTAALYGLEILDHDINSSDRNTTCFAVVSKSMNVSGHSESDRFIMMFTVENEAGSLARAVNIIGDYGFNMELLRSHPLKKISWQYYFLVEAQGDINSQNGQDMLEKLSECCDKLKLIGTFTIIKELN